ncbi:nitrogen regulatory protein [Pasteurella multocida]|uniref:PTS IIA-like nitrogen-regulatory protein PtsN n=1 Tax=Pasteurella dagmatis ATCC 43325 TaxID=667128 RepID=C9PS00_9PAST|nr:PTS IIA-like nitrogen regulatory protein PtsN [Pasteurella dagmatis]EEX49727.1 PTS IIA-like nitrogen-regulatory protein PtsN [Pasteurella dagmatis ATCC 43325]SNV70579.1 nitrogen regulatory protein [Pasteurella dagmatis]VEI57306.1 nitrogen regulatory protein [Pasteurella multocida]
MTKFTELLKPENIRQGIICSSKKRVFETITSVIADQVQLENAEQCCFECLFNREKLGNSGLGNGIAMPKARIPNGDKPIAVFLQLDTAVEYDSSDHRDVDLVFALLIPEQICAEYITKLPEIAENLSNKTLCKQLRTALSADEIWKIFEHYDQIQDIETEVVETPNENKEDVSKT